MRRAAAAAAGGLLAACVLGVLAAVGDDGDAAPAVLYPEHMVDKAAQYGFGYGKPGIGYGPSVWAEEARRGEARRFPWPMSSERWWRDYNDGPGLSNDGRAYPIPYIAHLRDDLAGGDMFDSMDTPADAAPDHTGGGGPALAWDAYAYTPWVRSITPTKAPPGEWHQRRWSKVLRALWDKKYYLTPYYASEPLHSPVLHTLHLKDYLPDMGGRAGDGSGARPESQRLMASGAPDSSGRAGVPVPGRGLSESQRLSHPPSGVEHPFAAALRQPRGRDGDIKLAAKRRLERKAVASQEGAHRSDRQHAGRSSESIASEANGGREAQRLLDSDAHQREDRGRDTGSFFSSWGGRQEVLASTDEESPPSSPGGVARWWKQRKQVRVPDAGDIWQQSLMRRQRAQERVVAKAKLLDLCFGTLHHHPADSLVRVFGTHGTRAGHAGGGGDAAKKERGLKKEEACRMLREAGHGA